MNIIIKKCLNVYSGILPIKIIVLLINVYKNKIFQNTLRILNNPNLYGECMAKDKKKSEQGAGAQAQEGVQPRIVWDDSDMRSVYANATNVAGGREEIVLLFGMNQSWQAGEEVTVQLSDRIVLSPFAAKRLSILLNNVLNNYEQQFGKLDIETRRPDGSTVQ